MEFQVQTFVLISSIFLVVFILLTVYLITILKLNDIKLKKSEEKLRELNFLLADKVKSRTKELNESEKKYRLLYEQHREVLENSPAGIIQIDNELVIRYANPEMNFILGHTSERYLTIKDKPVKELGIFQNEELDNFFKDLQKGFEISEEIDFIARNKKNVTAILHGVPLLENGNFNGAVIMINDITELKDAQDQIRNSLVEKELLLKEINHRVKNNMQIISSMMKLQLNFIKDNNALRLSKNSLDRVKTMALVHEKLYQSEDLAQINFGNYIRSLVIYLYGSYNLKPSAIKMNINIDDIFMDINTAIPCGLIVNELVSNSMKHAFPDQKQGEIEITLKRDIEGQNYLVISDNGIGFPDDFDVEKSDTLGLQLLHTLVTQLHGKLKFDQSDKTKFIIQFQDLRLNTFKKVDN